ncbi:MAG: ATP-binding cassette domain-containing protein, partial [Promethearchaeota archaeon]
SILTDFDLIQYKTRSPLNLSGGEMKKLSIASIICRDPQVLIFDEPTIGQDYKSMKFFLKLLENEKKKKKAMIIVTHDIEFAMEHLPRILLMQKGEILADGPTKLVLKNKALIKKGSLISPQIYTFKESLEQMGIKISKEIQSPHDMIQFLQKFLKTGENY